MSIGTSILFVDGPFSRLVRVFRLRITENEVDSLGGYAGTTKHVAHAGSISLDVVAAMRFVAQSAVGRTSFEVGFHLPLH